MQEHQENSQVLKILYCLTRSDTIGGVQWHVLHMCSWLLARGVGAHVIVGGEGIFCDELRKREIPYSISAHLQRKPSPYHDVAAIFELRRLIRDIAPTIVSLHSTKAGLVGRLASVRLKCSVVFTAHGWAFTDGIPRRRAWLYRMVERIIAPLADRIITVSEYDRQLALNGGVGCANQLVAVLNAMPDSEQRAVPGESAKPVILSCVARLDEQKDHRTLLVALSQCESDNWCVNLIGDGPLKESLTALAAELAITDKVNFLGFRYDIEELLCASHVFVLPSNWEGLPRSIIEALRAGLPVIATDVGGVAEQVHNGINGYVTARGDVDDWRRRLQTLIESSSERERMGEAGRSLYDRQFVFKRMATENLTIYENLEQKTG